MCLPEEGTMRNLERGRTLASVVVTILILGAATAGAAPLITGADVRNGSLTGKDVKDGSLGKKELKKKVQDMLNSIPIRVTGAFPKQGFETTNASVSNTTDGAEFGPYDNGGAEGGSVCTGILDGQPLSSVKHLAYEARYVSDGDTGGVGVPYLRIFLENDTHDAIFSPNTQPPDSDTDEGPFHTWVATAGLWRYDDDAGAGGQYGVNGAPFSTVKADHGEEVISDLCITTGFSAGTDLTALMRTWEINNRDYAFGL
jgi:hypothetical protein